MANTCSDLKKKFQDSLKATNEANKGPPLEKPKARKRIENPFEKQATNTDVASVKRREMPVGRENRLGDIKKRFTQFIASSEPIAIPEKSTRPEIKERNAENDTPQEEVAEMQDSNAVNDNQITPTQTKKQMEESPMQNKRVSLIQSSVDALKGSFEKLGNSKDKLTGAFSSKKNKKPSIADMQSYLISHVLYDGQAQIETVPPKKEDDILDFLEEEANIPEEELLNDEYIKGMQKYLSLFDDHKKPKKKKKKKKAEESAVPTLKTQQVSSLKEQFEITKKGNVEAAPSPKDVGEQKFFEPTVGKVKSMFETSTKPQAEGNNKAVPNTKRQSRMISNALIQKFDRPEMAEELKRQKEKEREDRKQERLKKLAARERDADEEDKYLVSHVDYAREHR